jgi:hypothetical protein
MNFNECHYVDCDGGIVNNLICWDLLCGLVMKVPGNLIIGLKKLSKFLELSESLCKI